MEAAASTQAKRSEPLHHPLASPRAILDALPDPHLLLAPLRDAAGKITDFQIDEANEASAKYYQLERQSMIGRGLLELLPTDSAGCLLAMARDAYESDEPLVANNFAFALEIYGNERRFDIRAVRIDGVQDLQNAAEIAEKLRVAAADPVETPAGQVCATMSIGVTLAHDGERTEELVARADTAMYRAKQCGRNQVVTFNGAEHGQPEVEKQPHLITS